MVCVMTMENAGRPAEMHRSRQRFALRAMTSVLISCASLMLLLSGIVLFLAPPGRIANWNGWNVLGIGKHGWGGLHVWFAVIFLGASVLHVFYNWRVLMAYFKHRHSRRLAFRMEWAVAMLICVGVFAGTRAGVVPFSSLLKLGGCGGNESESGGGRGGGGGHRGQGLSPTGAVQSCDASVVPSNGTAQATGGFHGGGPGGGGGMGRRTLADVCATEKVDIQQALARLQARGMTATAEQTLRDIATANQLGRPGEIVSIIRGDSAAAP